jgi:hypothetical protein
MAQSDLPNPVTTLFTLVYDLFWRTPPLQCATCESVVTRHDTLDSLCPACWSAAQWTGGFIDPKAHALTDDDTA